MESRMEKPSLCCLLFLVTWGNNLHNMRNLPTLLASHFGQKKGTERTERRDLMRLRMCSGYEKWKNTENSP